MHAEIVIVSALATIAVAFAPLWAPALRNHLVKPSAAAAEIAELLAICPDEWEREGRCYLRHESGIGVWIGNEAYALHVDTPSGQVPGMDAASMRHIWRACVAWMAAKPVPTPRSLQLVTDALATCRAHNGASDQ